MEDSIGTKSCSMCRQVVSKGAVICSHCQSDTNYQHFEEVPFSSVTRERHESKAHFSAALTAILCVIISFLGVAAFGFWVGIGAGVISFKVFSVVFSSVIGVEGCDKVTISCKECLNIHTYQWPEGSLDQGKPAYFDCLTCKQRTRVMSSPPVFDPSEHSGSDHGTNINDRGSSVTPGMVSDSLDR